jgi:hypothetical protein
VIALSGSAYPPELVVCDLDQGLLGNEAAEAELLETWMSWEDGSRPLLLFHSQLSLEKLQNALPSTSLPPVNFLVGAGTSMLVRFALWQHIYSDESRQSGKSAGLDPGQLLTVAISRALYESKFSKAAEKQEFPHVENAILTTSGLSVTFASPGRNKRANVSMALSWILKQLKFDANEVRTYASSARSMMPPPRLNMVR